MRDIHLLLAFSLATGGYLPRGMAEGFADVACDVQLLRPTAEPTGKQPVRVKVAGREMTLGHADAPPEQLCVAPADKSALLVAVGFSDTSRGGTHGMGSLWRIPCDASSTPRLVASMEGADFCNTAMARRGQSMFFTGKDGIFALDLRTWKSRRLTRARSDYCARNNVPARDEVRGMSESGDLLFERGCHYEHEEHGQGMLLHNPESSKPVAELAPRPPPAAIAIDAAGGIWLSDGVCEDRTTFNRLLYSSDRGQHWRSVLVKRDARIPFVDQPIRQIITDGKNPKALLVFTRSCEHGGQHTEPAWMYLSQDGGSTFHPVGVPPGIPNAKHAQPANEADPLYAVAAPQGSLTDLILYGQTTDQARGDGIGRWQSRDAGRTWKAMTSVQTPFEKLPAPAPGATFSDWKVNIEADGLYLSEQGKPGSMRIYPRR